MPPRGRNRKDVRRAPHQKTALVAAFQPEPGKTSRPHLVLEHIVRAAERKMRSIPAGLRIVPRRFPRALPALGKALDRAIASEPDILLILGEGPRVESLGLERVGRNRLQLDTEVGPAREIIRRAPLAYFSPVQLERAARAMRRGGTPTELSPGGDAAWANAAHFLALHKLARRGAERPLIVLVRVPTKNRRMAIQQATKGTLALLRFLEQNLPTHSVGSRSHPVRKRRSSPAALR